MTRYCNLDRFSIGLLATLTVAACCLFTASAFAGDYYTSVTSPGFVFIDGTGATPADDTFGKEYSHSDWFSVYQGGGDPEVDNSEDHNEFAIADAEQVVSWDGIAGPGGGGGNSGSTDAFDYGGNGQVDALANRGDFLFNEVVAGKATLLFSVSGDIDITSVPTFHPDATGIVAKDHVHYVDPAGTDGTWAPIEAPIGAGPGVNHHTVEDLDALEVWGPEPPGHTSPGSDPVIEGYLGGFPGFPTADADRFSLDVDSATGTSVWAYDIATTAVTSFIPHSAIVDAVEFLFNGGLPYDIDTRNLIDVDATMVSEGGDVTGAWDTGDELLFSIDPIDAPIDAASGGLAAAIDGGEIMHLVNMGPGAFAISFLTHGGYTWDTAFDVSGTFGYFYEDVDALEAVGVLDGTTTIAVPDPSIPEPSALMLIVLGLVTLLGTRRKR